MKSRGSAIYAVAIGAAHWGAPRWEKLRHPGAAAQVLIGEVFMALKITDDCTSCDACVGDCPNEAISSGSYAFVIDAARCTECVGAFDEPQCKEVCPADCIVADPDHAETREQLEEKYRQLH